MFYNLKQPLFYFLLFLCSFTAQSQVAPLLQTQWGQKTPYNDQCPSFGSKRCLAGCLPLAIAQIVNYHKYPQTGMGTVTYKPKDLPRPITVNFADQQYTWENQTDADIAKLVYHCGVLEQAQYSRSGTNAGEESILALKKHFGYSHKMHAEYHELYSDDEWFAMIKRELDAGRPVLYLGENKNGTSGHAWVCDGYNVAGQLHFNFGWKGDEDSYYNIGDITPKSYNFSYRNAVWISIEPEPGIRQLPNLCFRPHDPFINVRRDNGLAATDPFPKGAFFETLIKVSNAGVVDITNGPFGINVYIDTVLVQTKKMETVYAEIDSVLFAIKNVYIDPITSGTHVLRVVLDPDNEIAELDETDNVLEYEFVVAGRTDLPNLQIGSQPGHEPVVHAGGRDIPLSDISSYPADFFTDAYLSFSIYNASAIPVQQPFATKFKMYGSIEKDSSEIEVPDAVKEHITLEERDSQFKKFSMLFTQTINPLEAYTYYRIDSLYLGSFLSSASRMYFLVDKGGVGTERIIEELCEDDNETVYHTSFKSYNIKKSEISSICVSCIDSVCDFRYDITTINQTCDTMQLAVYFGASTPFIDTLVYDPSIFDYEEFHDFHKSYIISVTEPDTLQCKAVFSEIENGRLKNTDSVLNVYQYVYGERRIRDFDRIYSYSVRSGTIEHELSPWDLMYVDTLYYSVKQDTLYIKWNGDNGYNSYGYNWVMARYANCNLTDQCTVRLFPYAKMSDILIVGDTTFCTNESIELRGEEENTWIHWSTGEHSRSVTVGPGSYYCWYTDGVDTVYSDTLVLKDYIEKKVHVSADTTLFCPGDTVIIKASEPVLWDDGTESAERVVTRSGNYTYQYTDEFCGSVERSITIPTFDYRKARIQPVLSDNCQISGVKLRTQDVARWSTGDIADTIFVTEPGEYTAVLVSDEICAIESDAFTVPELPVEPEIIQSEAGLSVSVPEGSNVTWFANNKQLKSAPATVEPAMYEAVCVDQFGCISYDLYDNLKTGITVAESNETKEMSVALLGQFAKITVPQEKTPANYQVCSLTGAVLHRGTCKGQTFVVKHVPSAIISVTYTDGTKEAVLLPGK